MLRIYEEAKSYLEDLKRKCFYETPPDLEEAEKCYGFKDKRGIYDVAYTDLAAIYNEETDEELIIAGGCIDVDNTCEEVFCGIWVYEGPNPAENWFYCIGWKYSAPGWDNPVWVEKELIKEGLKWNLKV